MNWKRYLWPAIGLAAVCFSLWVLWSELRGVSVHAVWSGVTAIGPARWLLAIGCAITAYAALAGYDHIALLYLEKRVSWVFVSLCSFTTYALSHNIGGSVFSGAMIRYRAYGTRGLSAQDVGVLVAICWLTFTLATIYVLGLVLLLLPNLFQRFADIGYGGFLSTGAGAFMLLLVAAYIFGSWLKLSPLKVGPVTLYYPRLTIVVRQLVIGPVELLAAAGILYFALPAEGNPGYLVVLGIFLVSFSVAQISHAPGGLGVFEAVALAGLPDMDQARVLAALLVFRLLYLIIPLLIALVVVLVFERSQFAIEADEIE